jgi:hypothetical protein
LRITNIRRTSLDHRTSLSVNTQAGQYSLPAQPAFFDVMHPTSPKQRPVFFHIGCFYDEIPVLLTLGAKEIIYARIGSYSECCQHLETR